MQSNSKKTTYLIFSGIILFLSCFNNNAVAQGDLLITPKRILFEGNKRSEEINLANIGKDTATYVVSFIQIRMKDDGTFEKITEPDPGQLFADKNLRFFPRTVTLGPNEAQTVKVQIIKTGDLPAGEYRSHIYLRANPAPKPLGEEVVDTKDSTLSVKLVPIFGISIPVIIRKGEVTASASITDAQIEYKEQGNNLIAIGFKRSGNMSLYGNVMVDHISPQGKSTRVGVVKGMAIYTPNNTRRFKMQLDTNDSINYHEGILRVTYNDQSAKPITLASTELTLH